MAVSGSKNFAITRADIITKALQRIGEYDQGEAASGSSTSSCAMALNLMVKEWAARGIDIWLRSEVTVFIQPDTKLYALGTAHATTSYSETTLSAAEAAAQTVLSVTSSSGMTAGDYVGIKLDDDSIQWTTIVTVDSSTQITITAALTSAAASGNKVYAYTTKATRPQKILSAFRRDVNGYDTPLAITGSQEYQNLSDKGASGEPTQIWYHPILATGSLYVWPVDPGSNCDKIILIAQNLPDDFDAAADNPEFPIEWGNALIWGLAAEIASEYGVPEREQGRLWSTAEFKLKTMLDNDVENASVIFGMA